MADELEPGASFITTRQTPGKRGMETVHEAEVQRPGFAVLIRDSSPCPLLRKGQQH